MDGSYDQFNTNIALRNRGPVGSVIPGDVTVSFQHFQRFIMERSKCRFSNKLKLLCKASDKRWLTNKISVCS